jgi:hypothetical protein
MLPLRYLLALRGSRFAIRGARHALVPVIFGLLLLAASVLKGYELFAASRAGVALWTWRGVAIAGEGFLGIWLLSGLWARGCRWAALSAFLAFSGVSTSKALASEATCSCFGAVQMSPGWTAALDLSAILALWLWHPVERSGWPRRLCLVLFVGVSAAIILAVSRPTALNNPLSPAAPENKALLVSLPRQLDFGVVPSGGLAEARFTLRNPGANTVQVGEITASCGCFRVVLNNTVIGPGETTEATARLDLAEEPDFVGRLRLTAVAGSEEKLPAFIIDAKVTVEKRRAE